ncbi:MAG: TonB-dependent receptor [Paraglaciecola polaris]|uniref:TonB-dependent receptor n=1 Tax=Paraglaciecola polaris TaxID=222814 RepID=UPI003001D90D|tara:strand:+ start:7605 stop:9848 length:2244 start_codon:yes stop_codon:yes gene_type:complete
MGNKTYSITPLAAMMTSILTSSVCYAQAAEEPQKEKVELEKIVITSQKRSQNLQEVGASVTAFSGDILDELGLQTPKDVAAFTPGLSTTNATSGGTPIFAIRGVGLDDYNINSVSGVGVYIDEVLAGNPAMLSGQIMDVERVEVLKGPQGTLYGKNTTGGAISYISNKPQDYLDGAITLGYSKWNTSSVNGFINSPLTDDINGRLAFSYKKQADGWQEDIGTGIEYGKVDQLALRGMLSLQLSDSTEALLSLRYSQDQSLPESPQGIDFFASQAGGFSSLPNDATRVDVGDLPLQRDEEGSGATLHITADFQSVSFTSITAWDKYDRFVVDNYNGFSSSVFDFVQDNEVEQVSQEFRLTSTTDSRFSWISGIIYSVDKVTVNDESTAGAIPAFDVAAFFNTSEYQQTTDSFGAYLHTETELSDALKLTVGLRYSADEKEFVGRSVADFGGGPFDAAVLDQTEDESSLTYRLGLDYQLSDDVLIYTNAATGYKTGAFYGSPVTDQRLWSYAKPEELLSLEAGVKLSLLDNRMRINTVLFRNEYDDRQSLILACQSQGQACINGSSPDFSDPTDLFAVSLDNIDESEINGAELEIQWLPTNNLSLLGGVGYIDAKVKTPKSDLNGVPLATNIPKGATLSQAPKWSYNGIARYEVDINDDFYARFQLAYSYKGEQRAALSDTNAIYGPVKSLDARIVVGPSGQEWEVALWAKNITDEAGETYAFSNYLGGKTVYRQRPISFGIEATFYTF